MQVLNSDEGESLQCLNFSITKTVKANMELGSLVVVDIFIRVRCSMTNRTQGKYHVQYFVLAENLSPFNYPAPYILTTLMYLIITLLLIKLLLSY
jgi:hypothetical protein